MWTRTSLMRGGIAIAAALAGTVAMATVAGAQEKVLRAVMHADVRTLDPIWTTQTIAGIHGMLVYDTLFGNDDDMQPKPQMVDKYDISDDKLDLYLHAARQPQIPRRLAGHDQGRDRLARALGREGRRRAAGCSRSSTSSRPSTTRPSADPQEALRDGAGVARQDQHLGRRRSCAPRSRYRSATADQGGGRLGPVQVRQGPVGAGQQGGLPQERRLRAAARQRNGAELRRLQVRRESTASSSSGSPTRRRRCRRSSTARSTSTRTRTSTSCPILEKAKGVKLMRTGKIDSTSAYPAQPPPPALQQREGAAGDVLPHQPGGLPPRHRRRPEILSASATASSPAARRSATTAAAMVQGVQPKKALQLLKEAGYNGEPITVLARDRPQHHHAGDPGADPGHARGRPQRRRPVDGLGFGRLPPRQEGASRAGRVEHLRHHHRRRRLANPVLHTWLGAACDKGLFGWPCDAEIEKLRNDYAFALNDEKKQDCPRPAGARNGAGGLHPVRPVDQMIAYRADRIDGHRPEHRSGRALEHQQEVAIPVSSLHPSMGRGLCGGQKLR